MTFDAYLAKYRPTADDAERTILREAWEAVHPNPKPCATFDAWMAANAPPMVSEAERDRLLACWKAATLQAGIDVGAHLERGIRGANGVFPDWVYEAREAIRRQEANPPPWLPDLMKILGWQGGTVHQALRAVSRLVEAEKDRERQRARAGLRQPCRGEATH